MDSCGTAEGIVLVCLGVGRPWILEDDRRRLRVNGFELFDFGYWVISHIIRVCKNSWLFFMPFMM